MFALWYILKPNGLVINNGMVYLNISPIILIVLSVIAYLVISLFGKIYKTKAELATRQIEIIHNDKKITVTALVDSGNFLKDTLTDSEIIIVQRQIGEYLFGVISVEAVAFCKDYKSQKSFRIIPYKTVSGEGIMPAFKCEKVIIKNADGTIVKNSVLVGVIDQNFSDDYSAIVSPTFISE